MSPSPEWIRAWRRQNRPRVVAGNPAATPSFELRMARRPSFESWLARQRPNAESWLARQARRKNDEPPTGGDAA